MNYYITEAKDIVEKFIPFLNENRTISFDCETTGLYPFQGDKIFAMTFSNGKDTFYLERMLDPIRKYFHDWQNTIIGHNLKFDLHHLRKTYDVTVVCKLYDTQVGARLEYNDHLSYSLDACAKRIELEKDDAVEKYISENDLWEWQVIPGKKVRRKNKFYQKVPHEIMFKYACMDAEVTYKLWEHQVKRLAEIDALMPGSPKLSSLMEMEGLVTNEVKQIEFVGVKADQEYCREAFDYYEEAQEIAKKEFKELSGEEYKASPKIFEKVFASHRSNWEFTEKGNPSFESDVIKTFKSEIAEKVLTIRNAKSRCDFFAGFMFHSDVDGFVHPNFNQAGTNTGRFSSSDPNFQNLTNDEEGNEAYPTRGAIIPYGPDYCIVSMDYDQQEYRLLLEYAGELDLIEQIKAGVDVHQATADLMGVSRKEAKTLNFMLLYGGGVQKLADSLDISKESAVRLKNLYFSKLPKVKEFIQNVIKVAQARGYVHNWAGRRYWCQSEFAYRMPNRIIQGGGADIMKKAIVEVNKLLHPFKSTIFLTVHDELDFYIHKDEFHLIPKIKEIMENIFPSKYLKLTVSVSHSWENLGALKEGYPITPALEKAVEKIKEAMNRVGEPKVFVPAPSDEKLLKIFGLPRKTIWAYENFGVVYGNVVTLYAHPRYKIDSKHDLAVLEPHMFGFYCRENGLEARDFI